jgi:lipopolysaccharide/colanic/teichoic acid biosynthesis glycosyltransferase
MSAFAKILTEKVESYIDLRRSLGYSFRKQAATLRALARFVETEQLDGPLTQGVALNFVLSIEGAGNGRAIRHGVLRRFCEYLAVYDARTGGLDPRAFPRSRAIPPPRILSDQELASLIAACSHLSPTTPHRGRTLTMLVGLLASTAENRTGDFMKTILKRAIDIAGSCAGLLVLASIIVLISIAIRLNMGRPILFRQTRPGLRGEPFDILKFRTMLDAVDAEGRPLPDGARLTKLGRFLRSTSFDELPELWNVLKGEMSLVGPRPLLLRYLDRYTPEQMRRHEVRPGLTGWAQVNGRNAISWPEKFALDVWYVDNHSIALDMKIILLTILKVLRRDGISAAGEATMSEFGVNAKTSKNDSEQ